MVELNTPLKFHMNDLVYYLGISSGGNLGKQISLLGAIAAMAKGMLYRFNSIEFKEIQDEIDEFVMLTDMLDKAYNPLIDSNPYMFPKARRIRKGVHIAEVLAFSIIEKHNLVAGNIMRARLVEQFGKERIKSQPTMGDVDELG
jgi:hypothetical protein